MIEKDGAETVRLFHQSFSAPPEQSLEWNDSVVRRRSRFLRLVVGVILSPNMNAGNVGEA